MSEGDFRNIHRPQLSSSCRRICEYNPWGPEPVNWRHNRVYRPTTPHTLTCIQARPQHNVRCNIVVNCVFTSIFLLLSKYLIEFRMTTGTKCVHYRRFIHKARPARKHNMSMEYNTGFVIDEKIFTARQRPQNVK